jgi:hypothetical protein
MKRSSPFRFIPIGVVMVLTGMLLPTMACTSSRGCPPTPEPIIKIERVPQPFPVLVLIKALPPLALPDYPLAPSHSDSEEVWKAFALQVEKVAKEREAKQGARIEALEGLIADHNALQVPTPPMSPP